MSGAWGHMAHIYEDFDLTFGQLKEIFKLATEGNLQNTTEKTDGQNVFFTFDIKNNKLKFARNKTDIKNGGFEYNDILNKWQDLPKLQEGYCKAYVIFSKAFKSLDKKTLYKIFHNMDVWFSAEIIYSGWPNVIHYNRDILAIHEGRFLFYEPEQKLQQKNYSDNFFILYNALERLNKAVENYKWVIMGPTNISLQKSNKIDLYDLTVNELNQESNKYNLNDCSTIRDYIMKKFLYYIKIQEVNISLSEATKLANLFVDENIPNLQKRKLALNVYNTNIINNLFLSKNRDKIIKKIINPIENIIHDFSVELLNGVHSILALNPKEEVCRLRKRVEEEINKIKNSAGKEDVDFINQQLLKLKNVDNITSSIEGVVFKYNNKIYKLTGNFSVVNQILGYYRFK